LDENTSEINLKLNRTRLEHSMEPYRAAFSVAELALILPKSKQSTIAIFWGKDIT
jgi:hypothetical protein